MAQPLGCAHNVLIEHMRILLTNDDGILAPGLVALEAAVRDMGEVSVVAPAAPQSAAGHGITVGGELAVERVSIDGKFWGLSVAGRPADCVKLAFRRTIALPAGPGAQRHQLRRQYGHQRAL